MAREIIETGKSVQAAIESACEKLGCSREDCDFEIIDMPKKSFLGLRSIPAKVRVWIDGAEPEAVKTKPETKSAPKPAPKAPVKTEARPAPAPAAKTQTAPAPRIPQQRERPVQAAASSPAAPQRQGKWERRESVSVYSPQKAELAANYLENILRDMELTADLDVREDGGGVNINIIGSGIGVIIGRRGETLDAVQYLTSLVANRADSEYMRVTVDCGNYRVKRKDTLETLARKLASQVLRSGSGRTLEPMNPFERRVIHATVSEIEGVISYSAGDDPNRRVVITTPGARNSHGNRDMRIPRGYDNRGRSFREDGSRPPPRRDRDIPSAAPSRPMPPREDRRGERPPPVQKQPYGTPPKETPESSGSGKLYGKIDLE